MKRPARAPRITPCCGGHACALSSSVGCRLLWRQDERAPPRSARRDCGSVHPRGQTCRLSSGARGLLPVSGHGRPDAGVGREVSRRRHRGVGGAAWHRASLRHRAEGGRTHRRPHPDWARRRRERAGFRREARMSAHRTIRDAQADSYLYAISSARVSSRTNVS